MKKKKRIIQELANLSQRIFYLKDDEIVREQVIGEIK
jgi:hypothetical protein